MLSILLICVPSLWTTASSQHNQGLPLLRHPETKAFLSDLDHVLLSAPFSEVVKKYAADENLQDTSCSKKMESLNANLHSNQTSLKQESIACKCTVNFIVI